MINVGDKVICIQDISQGKIHPAIPKGSYYIVNAIEVCCNRTGLDLGIPPVNPPPGVCKCAECNRAFATQNIYWDSRYFRKVEPEYRVVEVATFIKEETKELIPN